MKRLILIVISLCITMLMQAQVSKTVNVTAGALSAILTPAELNTVTNLTLMGTIDVRDFKTMRDSMPALAVLDLGGTAVAGYYGPQGTDSGTINYPANEVPCRAFYRRNSLKSVILPSSVTVIGNGAFNDCVGLTSVTLPASVNSIEDRAFESCSGLRSITIPSSVNFIGDYAFSSCSGLTSITIPNSVTNIGVHAFSSCTGLTSINLSTSVTSIMDYAFYGCTRLSSVIIPSSVTSIGEFAFSDCTGLTSLTIPSSVTRIVGGAFYGCRNLTSIYAYGLTPIDLPEMFVFSVNKTTCKLYVPFGTSALYAVAATWKIFDILEMPFRLSLSSTNVLLPATGIAASVAITSNVTWTASSDKSWLTVNPTAFTGDHALTLAAEVNPSAATRTANVTISSTGVDDQILKVSQAGPPKKLEITAGGLFTALTEDERSTMSLILTGTIDARDFKTMRDNLPLLTELDLSGATIAAYSGPDGTSSINFNYPANEVPVQAFNKFYNKIIVTGVGKSTLTSIILPLSVTSVGVTAFGYCTGLTSITLPASVTSIGDDSFGHCTGLTSITITSSVTNIGAGAFAYCRNLTSIYALGVTPVDLRSHGYVFNDFNKTTCTLHVPFGSAALYAAADQWKDFTNIVEMPGFHLSAYAFSLAAAANSTAAVAITTSNVTWAASSDKSWLTVNPTSFNGNHTLTLAAEANLSVATRTANVTISSAGLVSQTIIVTQIGLPKTLEVTAGGLFTALTADERSTITSLKLTGTIDARDFKTMRDNMPSLTKLDLSGTKVVAYSGSEGTNSINFNYPANEVPVQAFSGKSSLTSVILPPSVTSIGELAFSKCSGLTSINVPSTVTSIGIGAFSNCFGLTSVNIPPSVTSIGDGVFRGCSGLISITIPSSVTSIGDDAFNGCTGLTSFTIPSSVNSIGDYAFAYCRNLTSITIPSSVTFIGYDAFSYCTGLTSIDIPSSINSIANGVFRGCTGLTSITIPSSVTTIGDDAFNGCTGLTSFTIPSSVTSIGDYAFSYCRNLTSITIPSSVTFIGDDAFSYCTGLTSIDIPSSITSIANGVFRYCTGLTSITLPSSVTSIGVDAFSYCSGLTSITIPSSVNSIGKGAFNLCTGLISIYAYRVTPVDLSSSGQVFYLVTCTLHIPYGSSALYAAADQWKDFTNIVEIPVAGSIAASQSICSGMIPAPLTSTGAGAGPGTISYRWEYSDNGTAWVSTGTSGETYAPGALVQTTLFRRITISTLNGTSLESAPTEPVTITVTPGSTITPTVSISASQNNVCAGTPVTFTATPVNGGTTPAYTWFLNNVAKATGATGSYTPKNGDVIYVEMTSGLACVTGNPATSNAITMVVNEAASESVSINVSQNNVCAGTHVTFTATPVGGGTSPSYLWFLNNVAKATGATGTYVPKNGDVVYVEMKSNHACSTGNPVTSNAITMVVNEAPSESVSINISQNHVGAGTPITFTAIPVGGGTSPSFLWYLNNEARVTGVTGDYIPKDGDKGYVVMTSGSPCASPVTSDVVMMIVDGIPAQPAWFTQGKSDVYQGQSDIRYTVPNVAGVTYHWSYDGTGATITGTSNSVLISFSCTATSGTLSVRASNSYGISEPRSGVITVGTTVKAGVLRGSAGQVIVNVPGKNSELKVYPNPSSGPVTFDFRITEKAKVILELFSSSGMRVSRIYEGDVEADVIHTVIFNESLAPGVYIYMLKWKNQVITGKLIRKR